MPNVWDAMKKHRAEQEARAKAKTAKAETAGPEAPAEKPGAPEPKTSGSPPAVVVAEACKYSEALMPHHDRGGMIAEQYRVLRTSLLSRHSDKKFCMMITSAEAGEGKTLTCLNLALVLAERQEYRTIVLDADLRKGRVAALLGGKPAPGIADLLRGSATLKEVIRPTAYSNVFVIPSGRAKANEVGELLAQPQLHEIVADVRKDHDFVLLDTPPVNSTSDTGMLGAAVGQALLVMRMNKTSRDSVDRAIRLLHAANVKISGMVLTHQKYFIPNYLYRYS